MSDNATPLILLTRPHAQAARYAALCRAEFGDRAEVMAAPMQQIVWTRPVPEISEDTALIFTSENGVRACVQAGAGPGRQAFCVGERTAEAARQAGMPAVSANGTVADLVALILKSPPAGPLLHLHGGHVHGDLVGRLTKSGLTVTSHVAYDQRALPLALGARDALASPRRVIAPLFSPRSAGLLAGAAPECRNTALPCISKATVLALPALMRDHATISDAPTGAAMLIAIARQLCP
jgi:uroporphyrinogen-III synthase